VKKEIKWLRLSKDRMLSPCQGGHSFAFQGGGRSPLKREGGYHIVGSFLLSKREEIGHSPDLGGQKASKRSGHRRNSEGWVKKGCLESSQAV